MTVTITKEENEKALECVLRSRGFSKRLITRLKRTENGMTRKGVLIRTVDLVYENDIIMINEGDGESLDPNPDLKADILYEDSEVVVFSKPPFMPCHPSIKHRDDTLGNLLPHFIQASLLGLSTALTATRAAVCLWQKVSEAPQCSKKALKRPMLE